MKCVSLVRVVASIVVFALPVLGHAQEATLSGTVTDTTGGALPGVTVRAVHEASGNSFEAVTDSGGEYRIPVRVGSYRLNAELSGFAPVTRTVTLLVGQQAVVNLQMAVSGVQESVTVTGEAPLLDVAQSSLGGNVDSRQLQDLPVNGRNWVDLVALAPGARVNATNSGTPTDSGQGGPNNSRAGGDFQINVDGQAVTQLVTGAVTSTKGQPRFNRDAIAEFEFLSSRFDATQGRSSGLQVNAVTKSGTNTPAGSFAGYFRHDRFNAADHVANRVLPYQNQQLSATLGGPIRRDRIHIFANYQYEREPQTKVYTTPFAHFNRDAHVTRKETLAGARLDAQFSPRARLSVRGNRWRLDEPSGGGGTSTPSAAGGEVGGADQLLFSLTQVLSSRTVNEVKVGYAGSIIEPYFNLTNPRARFGIGGPSVVLRGITVGGPRIYPNKQIQDVYSFRDDFTYSFTKRGRHTVKLGAEYLYMNVSDFRCTSCEGELNATNGPVPADIASLFPDLFDVSTWNLAPLSPLSIRWRQMFAETYKNYVPRYTYGTWIQDDWNLTPRLTLNLGVRYDLELNAFANDVAMGPFLPAGRPNDTNNIGPRVGATFSMDDRTVLRGGYGTYFGTVASPRELLSYVNTLQVEAVYDGRPDFASNPWNGPEPTYASLVARLCTPALERGCIRPEAPTAGVVFAPNFTMPYSHQASVGVQRQIGSIMGVEADYVYTGGRDYPTDQLVNISYDPATGANYPFADISRRPFPEWGYVSLTVNGSRSNYHALQTAVTRRFSNGWQASGTYTLSGARDARSRPVQWNPASKVFEPVPFATAPDLGGEYTLAMGDQRHRAVINGIWDLPYSFQLSGLYFFGSGARFSTNYGVDVRRLGGVRPNEQRLRPDGSLVPRNNFVGNAIHRVDVRLQRRMRLGGRAGVDGMLEVFNLFNHANYGSYVTDEAAANFRRPSQNTNVAYASRRLQLGFRFAF
jgi:hypothetical protein